MRVVADIEADGLPRQGASLVHCLCTHVIETGETAAFADHPGYLPMRVGLDLLQRADFVIGHNFAHYDAPMLKQFCRFTLPPGKILDTLDLCRLLLDIKAIGRLDEELIAAGQMPMALKRKLKLASWGYRLGRRKGDFGVGADWSKVPFSAAMVAYCIDDVLLTRDLYLLLEPLADQLA